jgi:hypothetical protein
MGRRRGRIIEFVIGHLSFVPGAPGLRFAQHLLKTVVLHYK